MIFVTVGTQLAFDRLVDAVDAWAGANPTEEVIGQIGPSTLARHNMQCSPFVSPKEADANFRRASLIVAHAGMGSILTALRFQKPILIMPRKAELGEHRNDHQWATAKWLGSRPGVTVAWDADELTAALDRRVSLSSGGGISEHASPELIQSLAKFINS